jgi:hypothetical protein
LSRPVSTFGASDRLQRPSPQTPLRSRDCACVAIQGFSRPHVGWLREAPRPALAQLHQPRSLAAALEEAPCARVLPASCSAPVLPPCPHETATLRRELLAREAAQRWARKASTTPAPMSHSPRVRAEPRDRVSRAKREQRSEFPRLLPNRAPIQELGHPGPFSAAIPRSPARARPQAARAPAAVSSSSRAFTRRRLTMRLGTEGGSRTHKPVRTADFESAAFAIPPLRLDSRARRLAHSVSSLQCDPSLGRLFGAEGQTAPGQRPVHAISLALPAPRSV